MIVLIRDELVYPPTWLASFRDLTLYLSIFHKCDVLIESEKPDHFYPWLRERGALDYVKEFIRPGTEKGIHLDTETRFSPTLKVSCIVPENMMQILSGLSLCHTTLRTITRQ